jgi:hypothetical protein
VRELTVNGGGYRTAEDHISDFGQLPFSLFGVNGPF